MEPPGLLSAKPAQNFVAAALHRSISLVENSNGTRLVSTCGSPIYASGVAAA
jgi:hypothetical protein